MQQNKNNRIGDELKPNISLAVMSPHELKSDGLNPNKMTPNELNALKASIKKYGFIDPIIVNKEYVIVDGEQRWQATKELGIKKVPVIIIDVKEVDRRILRQLMNKLKGRHDPLLDLEEFKKIYNEDGLKTLEELTAIPEESIKKLIDKIDTDDLFIDDIYKKHFYGEDIKTNETIEIDINKIKPNNWNPTNLSKTGYEILKKSIAKVGILNPIVVRKKGDIFEIIDGENRWKVAKELNMQTIHAKVIEVKNDTEAKAISFGLNKIKGKLDSKKSTTLVNEIRNSLDEKELKTILGLNKKSLDRYIGFGEEGKFFETASGLVTRQYTPDEYDEKKPSLIIIFDNYEDFIIVKNKLLSIHQDLAKALLMLCKNEQ